MAHFQYPQVSNLNRSRLSRITSRPQTPLSPGLRLTLNIKIAVTLSVCIFGVCWQLYTLSVDYFNYEIVSEVSIYKDDNVQPPAMSVCMPYKETIDWAKYGETEGAHPEFTRYIQEKYTIDQLAEMVPNISKYVAYAWIRKPNSYGVSEHYDTPPADMNVTRYIKDFYVCYRFMHRDALKPGYLLRSHHITYGEKSGALMGVEFDKKIFRRITRAIVYLHPVDIFPRGDRDYPLILVGNKRNVFEDASTYWGISYTEVNLRLLPTPYSTNCRAYPSFGYENEIHCQHVCANRKSLEKYGKGLFTVTETKSNTVPSNHSVLSKYTIIGDRAQEKDVDTILQLCNWSCPGYNCFKKYYVPTILNKRDDEKRVIFELYDMNGPQVDSVCRKKLTPISFMIGVISLIGIWLGLSCSDVVKTSLILAENNVVKKVQKTISAAPHSPRAIFNLHNHNSTVTHTRLNRVPSLNHHNNHINEINANQSQQHNSHDNNQSNMNNRRHQNRRSQLRRPPDLDLAAVASP